MRTFEESFSATIKLEQLCSELEDSLMANHIAMPGYNASNRRPRLILPANHRNNPYGCIIQSQDGKLWYVNSRNN